MINSDIVTWRIESDDIDSEHPVPSPRHHIERIWMNIENGATFEIGRGTFRDRLVT